MNNKCTTISNSESNKPRDANGRFVSPNCPICHCGTLRQEAKHIWRCDGLVAPEDPSKELAPCGYSIIDGVPCTSTL